MNKMQLFGKYWKKYIKNLLITSRIIYSIVKKYTTKEKQVSISLIEEYTYI